MRTLFDVLSPFSQDFRDFNYSPATRWDHFFSPQIVFNSNPDDMPVESHVLQQVGSYGKQLGVLLDAVGVLCEQLPKGAALSPEQHRAVQKLQTLRKRAKQASETANSRMEPEPVDEFIRQLRRIRKLNPARYQQVAYRLERALGGEEETDE